MCQSPRSSERRTAKIDPNGYGSWGLPFLVQHRLPGVHVKRLHFQSGSHGRLPEIQQCGASLLRLPHVWHVIARHTDAATVT